MGFKFIRIAPSQYFNSFLLLGARFPLSRAVTPSELSLVCAAQRLLWYKFAFNRARDLSPLVAALRVHEGHLNVVSSVRLVVVVPLQPTIHLAAKIVSHSLPAWSDHFFRTRDFPQESRSSSLTLVI